MRITDLIIELQTLENRYGDIEIRLAHQPRWAFEYSIDGLGHAKIDGEHIVYLSEGTQIGYLPQAASVAIGWSEGDEEDEDEDEEIYATA